VGRRPCAGVKARRTSRCSRHRPKRRCC
jgi:hypothetical protein